MRIALAVAAAALSSPAWAELRSPIVDPLGSGQWDYHQEIILGDPEHVVWDDRVVVSAPASAEDSLQVPLLVDATGLDARVERIVVTADYGPIPHILTFEPGTALPKISLRFKIDQATAVRASVLTEDGVWHIGGTEIDAHGGGCTQPALAYAESDWEERLMDLRGRVFADRARVIVDHPMDTGLAGDIPMFIVTDLDLEGPDGARIAHVSLSEPVSEDPAFGFWFADGAAPAALRVTGRDNNGNRLDGWIGSGEAL